MEESHRKVLKKLRLKISRNINVRRVTESLFSGEILDENDRERILAETTTEYKALRLLDLLPRKGSQAFPEFLKALRSSGSGSGSGLANAIQSELSGEQPAGESNERRPTSVGLPRKVPKFVGRMDVCDEITHFLATDQVDYITSLITIVAPPGFGKTAVATNIGYRMLEEGKDVLYFSLRNVCNLNRAAEDMLKKLAGVHAGRNPVKQLRSYLTLLPHQTVLILDNAEDLQIGDGSNFEDFLEEIGQHALNVVTIITSRNAVSKLELFPFQTKHTPLKPLTVEDSAAYLRNHVPDLPDHHVRAFAKACRGVPLLLTITGSFLKRKTIDPIDLHRKLQNCPHSFLKAKDAKIQDLYSLLQVFYNNSGPDMKEYLAYLASFPTSFTKEEAKDVLFPNEDYFDFQLVLDNLEQHSLVQQDEDQNKQYYSLHPLVQAFCKSSRKDSCTRYNTAIRLFSKHYLSLLQRMNSDFISTDCKTVIDEYHEQKANISHAILASTEDDDNNLKQFGLRVSTEAVNFLAKVLKEDEFMSLYSQCLQVAEGMADKTLYNECLVSIGFKQLCNYGYKDAYHTDAKRSLQEAHDLQTLLVNNDSECKGHCKCKLGLCCFVAGDKKKGISLIAQGIGMRKRLVRSEGSGKMERMLLAGGFCDLAMAMFTSGKYKAAVNIWTNLCLVRYRELLGTHPFTASLLHYIGDAYQKLGDPKHAVAFKKESLDMRKFLLVPREIQAQGHRAEAAFREAMERGSVEVYRGRIMLIGQDRAGKTSLKKFLLGMPFDPEEESTVGIKVDPTKFEVEIDQVKNWQLTDHKKLDLSEYHEDIAKITAEHMKALEGESQETTDSMDLEQELNDPSKLHDVIVLPKIEEGAERFEQSDASPAIDEPAPDSKQGSKAEIKPSTSNVQQNDMRADQDAQLIIDATAGLTLDDITENVKQCLQGLELNDDVKTKEVILSVWDFAGQNLYYASHSVFLSHRAVYVLVHNLTKDLTAQAKPCAKHDARKIELENPTNQTNLDNLLSWLVSVHCIRPTRDEASEVWEEKGEKCPPYLRPPVFVVGTHADKPLKDIRDTLQYIQESISGKRYDEHVIRPLYAVDNTRSASDYGVQALQNRISEVLKQEPYMGEKVPIRWFHFEKVVEALVANKIYHMELNELRKHTKQFCHIDKEDELETMLQFYHDLGVIVKHGRTVVLQALWLIDLFKQLINVRPYDERDPRYSGCWYELKEKGILRMDLVEHVFTDFIQKDLSKQDIVEMMEDHGLIAKFSFHPADGDHQQEYFVPSLLKSLPLALYEIQPSNRDPCPLYLHFLDGFVPHGLFAQLLSRCIVWCAGCSPEIPELYQNGAIFFFIGKQRIFDLVLICRKRFIKIILTQNPQASAPSTTFSATKAREVRVFLEDTLKDMREELSWLRNLRYEPCVACTHCLKSPDQCNRHSSVRCADDDCLHLLPLRPEEQLICRKNYAREPIKIYGLEKWLLVHEKESEERKMVSGNPKDAVKEGSPENDDLERLANKIVSEWKKLGRRMLESDEALLDAVDMDNDKCSEKAYKMLLKWKAAKGSDATFRVLHDALCHHIVNRRDLAEKFCLVTDD